VLDEKSKQRFIDTIKRFNAGHIKVMYAPIHMVTGWRVAMTPDDCEIVFLGNKNDFTQAEQVQAMARLTNSFGDFCVRSKPCPTCIYIPGSPLHDELPRLEAEVADPHVGFKSYRVCHDSKGVCCRGFWNAHKDDFPLGQVAQRLNFVKFVEGKKHEH
jgi:hypothetical protein